MGGAVDLGICQRGEGVTEREAEETRCCGPEGCGVVTNADRVRVADDAFVTVSIRWCIGAKCMAWRWGDSFWQAEDGRAYSEPDEGRKHIKPGFCGLAGKP